MKTIFYKKKNQKKYTIFVCEKWGYPQHHTTIIRTQTITGNGNITKVHELQNIQFLVYWYPHKKEDIACYSINITIQPLMRRYMMYKWW